MIDGTEEDFDLASLISEGVLTHMLRAAEPLRARNSINLDTLRFEIALLLEDTYRTSAWTRITAKNRKKLRACIKAISDYRALARRSDIASTYFPPPPVPEAWFQNAKSWLAEVDEAFADDKGGSQWEAWRGVFFPRALALFRTTFGAEPTSTVSTIVAEDAGPAVLFLHALLTELADADFPHPTDENKTIAKIKCPSRDSIKNFIVEYRNYQDDREVSQPSYLRWCRAYENGSYSLSRQLT